MCHKPLNYRTKHDNSLDSTFLDLSALAPSCRLRCGRLVAGKISSCFTATVNVLARGKGEMICMTHVLGIVLKRESVPRGACVNCVSLLLETRLGYSTPVRYDRSALSRGLLYSTLYLSIWGLAFGDSTSHVSITLPCFILCDDCKISYSMTSDRKRAGRFILIRRLPHHPCMMHHKEPGTYQTSTPQTTFSNISPRNLGNAIKPNQKLFHRNSPQHEFAKRSPSRGRHVRGTGALFLEGFVPCVGFAILVIIIIVSSLAR